MMMLGMRRFCSTSARINPTIEILQAFMVHTDIGTTPTIAIGFG